MQSFLIVVNLTAIIRQIRNAWPASEARFTRSIPLPSQALADDELHIPAAIVSDAAAKAILALAGATPSELQSSIDLT